MEQETRSYEGARPRIMFGGINLSPEDQIPTPVVALSYPDKNLAQRAAQSLNCVQNGRRPFSVGPVFYVGDTAVKIKIRRKGEGLFCEVSARADHRHLTEAFYMASGVSKEEYDSFSRLKELQRSYTLTVAHDDLPLLSLLNLVKYVIDERGV